MGSINTPIGRYENHFGLYKLVCGTSVLWESDEIALAVSFHSDGTYMLRYHGCPDSVVAWMRHTRDGYLRFGLQEFADELHMIVGKPDIDVLNRIIDGASGSLEQYLKDIGITN